MGDKEDHFWREHLSHRASRAPSQHVRALARMSDDIGPLRPAGERKVFHDRHGHVAGAMSAQAAFAAPWASATVQPGSTENHKFQRESYLKGSEYIDFRKSIVNSVVEVFQRTTSYLRSICTT